MVNFWGSTMSEYKSINNIDSMGFKLYKSIENLLREFISYQTDKRAELPLVIDTMAIVICDHLADVIVGLYPDDQIANKTLSLINLIERRVAEHCSLLALEKFKGIMH